MAIRPQRSIAAAFVIGHVGPLPETKLLYSILADPSRRQRVCSKIREWLSTLRDHLWTAGESASNRWLIACAAAATG